MGFRFKINCAANLQCVSFIADYDDTVPQLIFLRNQERVVLAKLNFRGF